MYFRFDTTEETFLKNSAASGTVLRSGANIWTTAPKSSGPITFNSTINWAKQVEHTAQEGYNVIFRQPRMYELFTVTPVSLFKIDNFVFLVNSNNYLQVYWFSLLHKKLMGNNVLEIKNTNSPGTFICAHCTRKQNSYVRRGALTVLVINENEELVNVKVKLGNGLPDKTMEVQEYVLTSNAMNST